MPIDSRWTDQSSLILDIETETSILDRGIDSYVGGHPWYRREDPTIVNVRARRRGFRSRAIFHIANVMPPADCCSISQLAVQFQFALFGGLATQLIKIHTTPIIAKLVRNFTIL